MSFCSLQPKEKGPPPPYVFCFLAPTAVDVSTMSTSPHIHGNCSLKLGNHMILAVNFHRSTLSSTPALCVHLQHKRNSRQAPLSYLRYSSFSCARPLNRKKRTPHPFPLFLLKSTILPPHCKFPLDSTFSYALLSYTNGP